MKVESPALKKGASDKQPFKAILTDSETYQEVLRLAGKVALTDTTVLITGETGTGKELLARGIHQLSRRAGGPLITVNCATLPEHLIESELFGHEKGAFTGAATQRKGPFELADGGTVFLDEIGELPLHLQARLLRVLQDGEFERVGGIDTLRVNVRILAATNRDLEEMVLKQTFRADLFYRLNVFPIHNPPLRERPEDISLLVRHFLRKHSRKMGKSIKKIASSDLDRLRRHPFPGNVRELENLVERALILSRGDHLNIQDSFAAVVTEGRFL